MRFLSSVSRLFWGLEDRDVPPGEVWRSEQNVPKLHGSTVRLMLSVALASIPDRLLGDPSRKCRCPSCGCTSTPLEDQGAECSSNQRGNVALPAEGSCSCWRFLQTSTGTDGKDAKDPPLAAPRARRFRWHSMLSV